MATATEAETPAGTTTAADGKDTKQPTAAKPAPKADSETNGTGKTSASPPRSRTRKPPGSTPGSKSGTRKPASEPDAEAKQADADKDKADIKADADANPDAKIALVVPEDLPEVLDRASIQRIVQMEAEADGLTGEADSLRSQSAGLIVQELEKDGVTERMVAEAIGKSPSHVHFAAVAWKELQTGEVESFNAAYKHAKAKKQITPAADVSGAGAGTDADDPDEQPFPPWTKQVRTLKDLLDEMVEQANLRQVTQLIRITERSQRAAVEKEESLMAMPAPVQTG